MPLTKVKYQEQACLSYSLWIVLPDRLQESSLVIKLSACAGVHMGFV